MAVMVMMAMVMVAKESSSESLWNHCQITVQIISGITGESLKMYI